MRYRVRCGDGVRIPEVFSDWGWEDIGGWHSQDPHPEAQALNYAIRETEVDEVVEVPYSACYFGTGRHPQSILLVRREGQWYSEAGQMLSEAEVHGVQVGTHIMRQGHPQSATMEVGPISAPPEWVRDD